jgi:thiol-disulfide isomerase/thioredoxin
LPLNIRGDRMRTLTLATIGLLASPLAAQAPGVRLDSISYADVINEIKGLKGKVVLVDVWGTFCNPCKEKFPRVVKLHEAYGGKGLAVISVSVDPPDDQEAIAAARKFVTSQRATFRNVHLTDKAEVWQDKWKAEGPPILFLFDRKGQLVARFEDKIDMDAIEKRIVELLQEK